MIFASLARAHERVLVHNVRDFLQAKLDSEMNARFLLNEHDDLSFSWHNFGVQTVCFQLKIKKKTCSEGKKRYS